MKKAIIIKGKTREGRFTVNTENTELSQRETLENIIVNLSTCLGISEIHKLSSTGFYYSYDNICYQCASNTILKLSELLLRKHSKLSELLLKKYSG